MNPHIVALETDLLWNGNYPGAVKMLRRSLPRLRDLPEVCQGVRVADLVTAARAIHDRVIELGQQRIDVFDITALPRITVAGCEKLAIPQNSLLSPLRCTQVGLFHVVNSWYRARYC